MRKTIAILSLTLLAMATSFVHAQKTTVSEEITLNYEGYSEPVSDYECKMDMTQGGLSIVFSTSMKGMLPTSTGKLYVADAYEFDVSQDKGGIKVSIAGGATEALKGIGSVISTADVPCRYVDANGKEYNFDVSCYDLAKAMYSWLSARS